MNKQCFAFKHKSDTIRKLSTSGGAFSAVAEEIIKKNGIVYGASLGSSDLRVRHIRIDKIEEIDKLRGAKYLQSDIGNTYIQVKEDLLNEKKVLFSGTPCQIAGLRSYLKKEFPNLYTCDIICHGVTSPLIWKEFVEFIEREHNKKVVGVCFRDKEDYHWVNCKETLRLMDIKSGVVEKVSADDYAKIFYEHEAMRPSCYRCKYTSVDRQGDITLGDFWGVETAHPELLDEGGVSFVMQNNERGGMLIRMMSLHGNLVGAALEETRQPQLYKSVRKPSTRNWFWSTYYSKGLDTVINKNRNEMSVINIRRKIISIFKLVLRGLITKLKESRK